MVFGRTLFRRVAIIGTGLIGGSLGLDIKKHKLAAQVVGWSRQQTSLKTAVTMGAIDEGFADVSKAVYGADLIILAAPVQVIMENIQEIGRSLRRGTIVTDVGSTKLGVLEFAQKHFPEHVFFVGSHPMAGSEKSGIANAQTELFKGASCIMTPNDKTNRQARDRVKLLWEKLGMQVRLMEAAQHDEALAFVSHLPHLAAFALMRSVPDDFLQHASGSLRDTTRVAGSSTKMWTDISISNYRNVLKALDEMVKNLAEIRRAVVDNDEQALATYINQARAKREVLEKKA